MDVTRLRSLTKYVFSVPRYYASAIAIALVSVGFGFLLEGKLVTGFLMFGVPALTSAVLSTTVTRPWSKSLLIRRSMFLSLISMLIIAAFFFPPYLVTGEQGDLLLDALIFGQALAFALSYFAIISITNINRLTCVLPASSQPLIQIGMLLALERTVPSMYPLPESFNPVIVLVVFGIIIGAVLAYVKVIDAPFRNAYGFSIFDLISSFFEHITSDSLSMERFFKAIGESVTVPSGHLLFRDRSTGAPKGMILVPYIHPGPLGNLGASNVTKILDDALSSVAGCLMVVHGPSTHDLNPTSAEETHKLAEVAKAVLKGETVGVATSTRFARVEVGRAKVCGQMVDGKLLAINTFSPGPTEDIDLGLGLAAMSAGREAGAKDVAFIDAHNCFTETAKSYHAGDPLGYDLIEGVSALARTLSNAETLPMRVGFGVRNRDEESVGPLGIRVCAMEIGDQRVAYVVLDGNNLEAGLRERIMERLTGLVDESEIMTSDNHSVNLVRGGFNPVGLSVEGLISDVVGATEDAFDDLSEATGVLDMRMIENINVFGPGKISEIVTTMNSMISMGKGFTAVLLIGVIALCFLIFIVFGSWTI